MLDDAASGRARTGSGLGPEEAVNQLKMSRLQNLELLTPLS